MIRVAVVGYGNIGRYVLDAVAEAPDMELAGVVRRDASNPPTELAGVAVTTDISTLGRVDVAILATPTRHVQENAARYLAAGINTVDSFDIHTSIPDLRASLGETARAHGVTAVIAAGWDPGSDSVVRALMEAAAPKGITYTNFGPGMSMGHSVCVRSKSGVKDALSVTIPLGTGIHRRMVYVELLPGAELAEVTAAIKADPYFASDETHVIQVDSVDSVRDMGHGVNMTRKGTSGRTPSQRLEFNMTINNPALTAQIMVGAARATTRLAPGAYTMIEIPMVSLLPGSADEWVKKLV